MSDFPTAYEFTAGENTVRMSLDSAHKIVHVDIAWPKKAHDEAVQHRMRTLPLQNLIKRVLQKKGGHRLREDSRAYDGLVLEFTLLKPSDRMAYRDPEPLFAAVVPEMKKFAEHIQTAGLETAMQELEANLPTYQEVTWVERSKRQDFDDTLRGAIREGLQGIAARTDDDAVNTVLDQIERAISSAKAKF